MRKKLVSTLLLGLAMTIGSISYAQTPRGTIEFKSYPPEVETTVKAADGKIEKKRSQIGKDGEKAVPGAVVIYAYSFKNISDKSASGIVIDNPIPASTTLVAGSTYGENTEITFSADGGKTWANVEKVKVKGADGKERAAGISELTHIRWRLRGELAPGKQGEVGFRVAIN